MSGNFENINLSGQSFLRGGPQGGRVEKWNSTDRCQSRLVGFLTILGGSQTKRIVVGNVLNSWVRLKDDFPFSEKVSRETSLVVEVSALPQGTFSKKIATSSSEKLFLVTGMFRERLRTAERGIRRGDFSIELSSVGELVSFEVFARDLTKTSPDSSFKDRFGGSRLRFGDSQSNFENSGSDLIPGLRPRSVRVTSIKAEDLPIDLLDDKSALAKADAADVCDLVIALILRTLRNPESPPRA